MHLSKEGVNDVVFKRTYVLKADFCCAIDTQACRLVKMVKRVKSRILAGPRDPKFTQEDQLLSFHRLRYSNPINLGFNPQLGVVEAIARFIMGLQVQDVALDDVLTLRKSPPSRPASQPTLIYRRISVGRGRIDACVWDRPDPL